MKKYISVFAIMLMIFLAACSNQNISSAPTSNESNTQSNSVTKLEEGVWPANEYTEGLPVPPGTVAWATLDLLLNHLGTFIGITCAQNIQIVFCLVEVVAGFYKSFIRCFCW